MSINEILDLSISERILIVEQIWDSITDDAPKQTMPERKKTLIQERLASYKNDPNAGRNWEEVKKKYDNL